MANTPKPYDFTAGTTILSTEVNSNFNDIYNDYNGNITNVNIASGAGIVASKLNLATVAQTVDFTNDLTMSGAEFLFEQGTDEASGTSIALDGDGNFYDITGTTDIQTITIKQAGSVVWLRFNGSLTLVDNTGNLELYGSDITVQTEDIVCLISDGTNWNYAGGTKAKDFSIGSQAQGDILYFDGTNWTRLGAGTSGQVLTTGGAAANPSWGNQDWELISTTTIASGTNSGNITIAAGNQYVVRFVLLNDANAVNQIDIAFNDSGADVAYWKENRLMHGTPTVTTTGAAISSVDVPLGSLDELNGSSTSGQMWGEMRLDTTANTNNSGADIRGMFTIEGCLQADDTSYNAFFIQGVVAHLSTALTSFEFVSSSPQNFTGTAYLYQLAEA